MPLRDPDDMLVVLFKHLAVKNEAKIAGRRPADLRRHRESCEIRAPGSQGRQGVSRRPRSARWVDDPCTGEQTKQTYAERFTHQYRQFKAQAAQTKTGTPLDYAPFLTEGTPRRAARAEHLHRRGAGRDRRRRAEEPRPRRPRDEERRRWSSSRRARRAAPNKQMLAELEALKARNAVLEEDIERARRRAGAEQRPTASSTT